MTAPSSKRERAGAVDVIIASIIGFVLFVVGFVIYNDIKDVVR